MLSQVVVLFCYLKATLTNCMYRLHYILSCHFGHSQLPGTKIFVISHVNTFKGGLCLLLVSNFKDTGALLPQPHHSMPSNDIITNK